MLPRDFGERARLPDVTKARQCYQPQKQCRDSSTSGAAYQRMDEGQAGKTFLAQAARDEGRGLSLFWDWD